MERLRPDDPRDDRVARDPVAAALHRERLREAEDARLRRRVARLAEAAERARHRRHVHDPPPAPLAHVRPHRLRAVERSREVDPQVALPELRALVVELTDVVERARVVDEDVDRAEFGHHAIDRGRDLLAVGDVAAHGERAATERPDLLDRRLGVHHPLRDGRLREHAVLLRRARVRLDEDVRDRDVRSRAGERQRVRPPEPT